MSDTVFVVSAEWPENMYWEPLGVFLNFTQAKEKATEWAMILDEKPLILCIKEVEMSPNKCPMATGNPHVPCEIIEEFLNNNNHLSG